MAACSDSVTQPSASPPGQVVQPISVIQSGRMEDIPGVDTVTGCCVNTLPLVLDIHRDDSVGGIVAKVTPQQVDAIAADVEGQRAVAVILVGHDA
mgnify:CR=1 FL=1